MFGATHANALAQTIPVSSFQSVNGCGGAYAPDFHGYVEGGNRVIEASVTGGPQTVNPNTSVNVGKFVYRMT